MPPAGGDGPRDALLPARVEVARYLESYRTWERRQLAAPADRGTQAGFEDAAYTLSVLMGRRCGREAVVAAENYLHACPTQHVCAAPPAPVVGGRTAQHAA
ncbi:DUF5133 domain-containing protein [Streptomyces sp. NPDC058067]|uniref:DUF5133 domain-containing protein n=1 Tax=Streptomyces sp. NPDC058067 TaxID=3346324 RepID=UPI0036EDA8FE